MDITQPQEAMPEGDEEATQPQEIDDQTNTDIDDEEDNPAEEITKGKE
jgi:hypothetical protein